MRRTLNLVMCLGMGVSLWAQNSIVGAKPGDFTLRDLKGAEVASLALSGNVTALLFISTGCPVSNAYNERMSALYRDYSLKGVKFIFVNSNSNEPAAEVADHMRKHGFPFAVYKDPGNSVADRFRAQATPEAFVLDAGGTVRYHGHIDDSQNAQRVTKQSLRLALDALLSGHRIDPAETKAFGCSIKRAKP
jgi:thiol-disulfide isomerase/thioredoxin